MNTMTTSTIKRIILFYGILTFFYILRSTIVLFKNTDGCSMVFIKKKFEHIYLRRTLICVHFTRV